MLFYVNMKKLQKFITLSLCLLCWHCSCDNKINDEISTKRPVDSEVYILHSVQNSPPNQEYVHHEKNVNIPEVEIENSDQISITKEIKSLNKQKLLRLIDIRISKYREQLRKMRRRRLISAISVKKIQKSSASDNVNNIEINQQKPNLGSTVFKSTVEKNPVNFLQTEFEASKTAEALEATVISQESSESQISSQESEISDKVVQKVSSSESSGSLESSETTQHSHSDAMPSFDEWKKMMLAEQEKGGHKVPSVSPAGKKITSQKHHRNYASYECGAKIVASNSEAEGTSRILNERLDEYMLNPCKVKAWFVIELCETVQVSQIELANFELFSSCPKDFTVSFSDSFPTRDWVSVRMFEAAEQRVLQSFQAKSEGFIKFIKVELLSHYGKEHYCPLNVVRVFGASMVDEYEEMEKMSDHHSSSDDDLDRLDIPVEDKSSTNIFGSATNAVYNIVKKAAQVLGQRNTADENSETSIDQNISEMKHCKLVDETCVVERNKSTLESNISDSLDLSFVAHGTLYNQLQHCDQCISFSNPLHHTTAPSPQCRFFQAALGPVNFKSICDWLKAHYLLPFQESVHIDNVKINNTQEEDKKLSPPPTIISVIIDSKSRGQSMPLYSDMTPSLPADDRSSQKPIQLPLSSQFSREESESTEEVIKPIIQPTKTLAIQKDGVYSDLSGPSDIEFVADKDHTSDTNVKKDEKIMSSMQIPSPKIDETNAPTVTIPLQTGAIAQNVTKKSEIDEKVKKSEEKEELSGKEQLNVELDKPNIDIVTIEPDIKDFSMDSKTGEIKFDSKDPSAKMDPGMVVSGTFSAAQKESVFVRMNNRIKALELNMSLSSQYLQELSQRYRRQMEEMQRAFNRTIGTLNDTARKATERDLKQQEIIGNLQSQLSNLTISVDEIIKRHILLMAAEVIVMVTIMSLCVRRISSVSQHTIPQIITMSGNVSRLSRSDMKRRNSAGSCSPPSLKRIKKLSSSDESLHTDELLIVEPSTPIIIEPPPKIKKKKKKKQMKRSSSNPVTSPRKCSSASFTRLLKTDSTCTAGLLFTHTDYEKDSANHSCENCYHNSSSTCDSMQNQSAEKRLHSVPLQNLTNGDLNQLNFQKVVAKSDKFSFRKFLRFQKRESI